MRKIYKISADIETFSEKDLKKTGVYPYAEDPSFEILLFGVAVNDGPVRVYDIANGEEPPDDILEALTDNSVEKWAYNASFERVCLSTWLRHHHPGFFKGYGAPDDAVSHYLDPAGWKCSRVWGAYNGLPMSLDAIGSALGFEQQKLKEGKDLVRYFCSPCKPTKANGGRTRNRPADAPDKWELFKKYNQRDVEVEMQIQQRLKNYPVPDFVWDEYHIDQRINDRGILCDTSVVENAIRIDAMTKESLMQQLQQLAGLENPNSVTQMKDWLAGRGVVIESLGKKEVAALLKGDLPDDVRRVLELRLMLAKSSVKKYTAMQTAMCSDHRCRGMFRFYGASRSGRFASAIIQIQNLVRNEMPDLEQARDLVKTGNMDALSLLYDNISQVLSELIRTAFIPRPGYKFVVSDYSSIEARVLAYLAGETHTIESFAKGEDLYCATASAMFGVPVVKHGINGELRQKGKIATLACIAEGQLVSTNHGLIPIEKVTTDDLVWDGEHFVSHDGVIFKDRRPVITFQGLTATPDHLVFVEGNQNPIPLAEAAQSDCALLGSGLPDQAPSGGQDPHLAAVYDIVNAGPYHRFTVSGHLVHNCGYGGSVGALKAMGALDQGLTEDELQPIVDAWREANPHIVRYWWDVDAAVKKAVCQHSSSDVGAVHIYYQSGMLFIRLPSGRQLAYVQPRIGTNRFGSDCITYMGIDQQHWSRIESYGPKFVENIVQAVARDILCYAMKNLRDRFIVGHVHDELIIEVPQDASMQEICDIMGQTPPWAPGLQIRADGYECPFYMKS